MESIRTRRASSSFSKKGQQRKTASSSDPETEKKGKRALSSSSSTPKWKHEVFLSFHGPDTRMNFTEHLYVALKQKGILTFKDDAKLERGKDISQELLKAIQESLYAIVILSANYASSKWCLKELAEIVECQTQTKLEILPIFYDVDPSDVRKQTGTFKKAFDKHAKNPETKSWRAALTVVGNIAGWDLRNRPQATYIQKIVGDIFEKLNLKFSSVYCELVGIESPVMEMMDLLGMGLNDVRFIGIHGMGGVGKTTLSQVIYDRVSHQFEGSSYLASVRESSRNQGLVLLQEKLLCQILKEREVDVGTVSKGAKMIASRLCHKMVLVVLDDVDTQEQLEALVGARDWFGPGSRIIFTNRDSHLLYSHGGKDTYLYELKGLNYEEALKFFSLKAFKKPCPEVDYQDLSNYFVNYTQGLPLALKVLGSFLFGRTKDQWISACYELEVHPKKKIMDVLRISFDGLEDVQKNLFLDIACFFKGEFLYSIFDMLEHFKYFPKTNVDALVEKSLITISMGMLCMHDLLQKMGQEIVDGQSLEEPGGRSRLWRNEDVLHVLKHNTGTSKVEGMVLNLPTQKKESLHVEVFSKMKKLRILYIGNRRSVRKSPKFCPTLPGVVWLGDASELMLPNYLCILEWYGYPFKSLPLGFKPNNLIELNMPGSHIEQLWSNDPIESLCNLKRLDLSECKSLTEKLNLTVTPNLESLHLEGCENLSKIHLSIFHLDQLKLLNLRACTSLQSLPDEIGLKSLERLYLSDCSRLKKLPDTMGNMTALRLLYLNGTSIKELPFSIESLSCLSVLSLKDCKKLSTLPSVFGGLSGLSSLKLVELPCSRFRDMDNDEVTRFWRYLSSRTTIKFFDGISMPVLHNLGDVSPEDFNYPKIEAVYIGFDGRPYGIHNWRAEADDLVCKVIYGSSVEPRMPHWFNNTSCSSSITLKMHPNLDDKRKVKGYALFVVYETNFFQSNFIDFDFETDEGPLSTRTLALRVDVECSNLSSIWVYIPANWFLVRAKNVDGWSYLKVSVSAIFKVKECGARLVHEHDAQEFYDSITCTYPLGSLDSEFLHHLYSYLEMDCYSVQPLH